MRWWLVHDSMNEYLLVNKIYYLNFDNVLVVYKSIYIIQYIKHSQIPDWPPPIHRKIHHSLCQPQQRRGRQGDASTTNSIIVLNHACGIWYEARSILITLVTCYHSLKSYKNIIFIFQNIYILLRIILEIFACDYNLIIRFLIIIFISNWYNQFILKKFLYINKTTSIIFIIFSLLSI